MNIKNRDHTIKYLIKRLKEAGITKAKTRDGARQWIQYHINNGTLSLRQRPGQRGFYVITEEEANQIIKEFSPEGTGYWHYQEHE